MVFLPCDRLCSAGKAPMAVKTPCENAREIPARLPYTAIVTEINGIGIPEENGMLIDMGILIV